MRTITETHTGKIISDTDLTLEYLYVGDYGKENNIKASFLGYDKRIDKVEHKDVDINDKLVVCNWKEMSYDHRRTIYGII